MTFSLSVQMIYKSKPGLWALRNELFCTVVKWLTWQPWDFPLTKENPHSKALKIKNAVEPELRSLNYTASSHEAKQMLMPPSNQAWAWVKSELRQALRCTFSRCPRAAEIFPATTFWCQTVGFPDRSFFIGASNVINCVLVALAFWYCQQPSSVAVFVVSGGFFCECDYYFSY